MDLYSVSLWVVLLISLILLLVVLGIGLGKFFALAERVDYLWAWIGEVRYELIAQEHAEEIQGMRERMDHLQHMLRKLHEHGPSVTGAASDKSGEVSPWA
ncbi:hypothetical protein [Nocardia concava]|uniref:hypothetical protein n=1 Tax=Nocardia concava TaxID=257281 RepID=UPI00030261BA|nr:hypothetical protein [Nocardia concava]